MRSRKFGFGHGFGNHHGFGGSSVTEIWPFSVHVTFSDLSVSWNFNFGFLLTIRTSLTCLNSFPSPKFTVNPTETYGFLQNRLPFRLDQRSSPRTIAPTLERSLYGANAGSSFFSAFTR